MMALPIDEKRSLLASIHKAFTEEVKRQQDIADDEWGRRLLDISASAMNVDSIGDSRSRIDTFGRTMVAYELRREGYSLAHIGELLHRDHSTVMWMLNRMKNVLDFPRSYREEATYWNNFNTLLTNEIDR